MRDQGNNIFFRSFGDVNPTIDHADGIYCYDTQGNSYIDGMGGVAVVSIGHNVQEIKDAIAEQMEKVCFAHPFHWINEPHKALTRRIVSMAPEGMSAVFMTSGGSEATESALKLARQYFVEQGKASKYKIIGRRTSYHGNTIGSLSMTGMPSRRRLYAPLLADFPHIPDAYCYRCPYERSYPTCGLRCASELEAAIKREGADNIAGFIAEPFVGAAGGAIGAPSEYFNIIRETCDKYDILMIMDEVITGFGRTGKNFGIDHWNVVPDLICTGKGMSSGYSPLGALIIHDRVAKVFAQSKSGFTHGHTFGGNPLSCAVGEAVLSYISNHGLIKKVAELGPHFFKKAEELLSGLDVVGDIRGEGYLMGIELVQDFQSKEPFDAGLMVSRRIADAAFKKGLVIGAYSSHVDGIRGDHVMLAPPFILDQENLNEMLSRLREAIMEVQAGLTVV